MLKTIQKVWLLPKQQTSEIQWWRRVQIDIWRCDNSDCGHSLDSTILHNGTQNNKKRNNLLCNLYRPSSIHCHFWFSRPSHACSIHLRHEPDCPSQVVQYQCIFKSYSDSIDHISKWSFTSSDNGTLHSGSFQFFKWYSKNGGKICKYIIVITVPPARPNLHHSRNIYIRGI